MNSKKANRAGVYVIANRVNGKCYVGSSINIARRWREHKRLLSAGCHHSAKLNNAWGKHGEPAFMFSVVEVIRNPVDLIVREQEWIEVLDSVLNGYNINPTAGSQLGFKHSDAAIEKMRQSRTGKKHSDERRANISAGQIGRVCSPETAAKIGLANRGRTHSEEAKARMSASRTGRKLSQSHIEKMRANLTGKKKSEEHRKNLSLARLRSNEARKAANPDALRQTREHIEKRTASIAATVSAKKAKKLALLQ